MMDAREIELIVARLRREVSIHHATMARQALPSLTRKQAADQMRRAAAIIEDYTSAPIYAR